MKKVMSLLAQVFIACILASQALALKEGEVIPTFEINNQNNETFKSKTREGKWTVFYFYPKASTPGCTKQACAFRDHLQKIKDQNADIFGISVDTVEDQKKFHAKEKLNFDLLADADGKVSLEFGVKSPQSPVAQRWTFIVDPALKVRWIGKDVDPALDALNVTKTLKELQKSKP